MLHKKLFILITVFVLSLFFFPGAHAQYRAAIERESIDPPGNIPSLALAGYGVPPEGRFTLSWIPVEPNAAKQIDKGRIVANSRKQTKWYVYERKIYKKGNTRPFDFSGFSDSIIAVTANRNYIYVLTATQQLYRAAFHIGIIKFQKIGWKNGQTWKQDMRRVFIVKEHLYATDGENYFVAKHNTAANIYATVLALGAGKKKLLFIALDLCGIDQSFTDEVKRIVFKKYKIPAEAILINASHTHFSPVAQNYPTWFPYQHTPDNAYLFGTVKNAILKAVGTSLKNLQPAEVSYGRGAVAIGFNRSLGINGGYDDAVDVLRIKLLQTGKINALFLAGCHPVFKFDLNSPIGYEVNGNYPAIAREILKEKYNVDRSIFIQGCAGDINPIDDDAAITAEKLSTEVADILKKPLQPLSGQLLFSIDSVVIPVNAWSQDSIKKFKALNLSSEDVYALKNERWADRMFQQYATNSLPAYMPVYIQHLKIGDWQFFGLSREAVSAYSIGIKKLFPGKNVSVAGYCNNVASYLPALQHIRSKTYEGFDSFFWYDQPGIFPESIYDIILNKIEQLWAK